MWGRTLDGIYEAEAIDSNKLPFDFQNISMSSLLVMSIIRMLDTPKSIATNIIPMLPMIQFLRKRLMARCSVARPSYIAGGTLTILAGEVLTSMVGLNTIYAALSSSKATKLNLKILWERWGVNGSILAIDARGLNLNNDLNLKKFKVGGTASRTSVTSGVILKETCNYWMKCSSYLFDSCPRWMDWD